MCVEADAGGTGEGIDCGLAETAGCVEAFESTPFDTAGTATDLAAATGATIALATGLGLATAKPSLAFDVVCAATCFCEG